MTKLETSYKKEVKASVQWRIGSSIKSTKELLRNSNVSHRDKNLIATLSFIVFVYYLDFNGLFLDFLLSVGTSF